MVSGLTDPPAPARGPAITQFKKVAHLRVGGTGPWEGTLAQRPWIPRILRMGLDSADLVYVPGFRGFCVCAWIRGSCGFHCPCTIQTRALVVVARDGHTTRNSYTLNIIPGTARTAAAAAYRTLPSS